MDNNITLLNQLSRTLPSNSGESVNRTGAPGFADTVSKTIKEADRIQKAADEKSMAIQKGDETSLHDAMIALEQADIQLRLIVQLRNKAVEAYQQIMTMQV